MVVKETNIKMKNVFFMGDDEPRETMLEYIQDLMGISEADWFCYGGRYVIKVPAEKYEEVLRAGKEFAVETGLINRVSWVDHYDEVRYPISSCDIAYEFLPETLLPKEEEHQFKTRELWCSDMYTPPYLLEYFDTMKNFLDVDSINRHYKFSENALIIAPNSLDYEEQMKKFKQFVEKYGCGPFDRIHPLTFTGEYESVPFQLTKKK